MDTKNKLSLYTNQTSHITKELFWNGCTNYEYTGVFKELIKNMNTFFDVGASIGYYSVLGGKINPNLFTYSFEPALGSMIFLSKNIKHNHLEERNHVEFLALSNTCGNIDFHEVKNKKFLTIYKLSGEHNISTKELELSKQYKVEAFTLDSYIEHHKIERVDLLKIDTEGSEHLVLEGAIQTIQNHKPIIICETLFKKIEPKLESIMKPLGYEFYNHIKGKKLEKVETIKREKDNGVRNCFFVHPSKAKMIKQFLK